MKEPRKIQSGFLIVKTFPKLYRDYVSRYNLSKEMYAIPRIDKKPEEFSIQYRGIDRDALRPNPWSTLPVEVQLARLEKEGRCNEDGFFFKLDEAKDIISRLGDMKSDYEIIWARFATSKQKIRGSFSSIGYEPSYFVSDHFSPSCDCMLIPRWHGTDDEGVLFLTHFKKLNQYGLFDNPLEAEEFLKYYLSFDWTEKDDYEIVEVFIDLPPKDGEDGVKS